MGFEKLLSQIGTKGNQSVQKVYWSCNDRNSLTLRILELARDTMFRAGFLYNS